ncbi:MAG: c-type cytochrome [Verrucomicrobiales bacterium]
MPRLFIVIAAPAVLLALVVYWIWTAPDSGESVAADAPAPTAADAERVFATVCSACHGPAGEGKREIGAPSIAALPRWHILNQLRKFRNGRRGTHEADEGGHKMRPIALALDEAMLEPIADYVQSLPRHYMQNTLGGDPAVGRMVFEERCIECHRYNASGEMVFGSPPLTGFPDWWAEQQIAKFRQRILGYDPLDENSAKMQRVADSLLLDTDARDALAYIATLAERERRAAEEGE